MEYKVHKCESAICQCFEISTVMERFKFMTYYEKYNAMKKAYVFNFSFLRDCNSGARTNRLSSKLMDKALPNTKDVKQWGQGLPNSWFTDPPKHGAFSDGCSRWTYPPTAPPLKLDFCIKKINRRNVTNKCCLSVRGVNNAPPSAIKRKNSNVHKLVQRQNQTESIAV